MWTIQTLLTAEKWIIKTFKWNYINCSQQETQSWFRTLSSRFQSYIIICHTKPISARDGEQTPTSLHYTISTSQCWCSTALTPAPVCMPLHIMIAHHPAISAGITLHHSHSRLLSEQTARTPVPHPTASSQHIILTRQHQHPHHYHQHQNLTHHHHHPSQQQHFIPTSH